MKEVFKIYPKNYLQRVPKPAEAILSDALVTFGTGSDIMPFNVFGASKELEMSYVYIMKSEFILKSKITLGFFSKKMRF
ncbi:hypothetical protein LEP1GSC043_1194 [Leptospira weilii str. Ecochallenge]|uniref:Uncharacterized protein n=1 Tax=Leptospira weilii str. Ecochallenge TaxID=1049986 RepID=N1TWZ1_9LEPT|nr:hypothetical protein LEP1GSC043_1194 [Leptospira weilii str. Ecochallenge]